MSSLTRNQLQTLSQNYLSSSIPSYIEERQNEKFHLFRAAAREIRLREGSLELSQENSFNTLLGTNFCSHPLVDFGYYESKSQGILYVKDHITGEKIRKDESVLTTEGYFVAKRFCFNPTDIDTKRELLKLFEGTISWEDSYLNGKFMYQGGFAVPINPEHITPCVSTRTLENVLASFSSDYGFSRLNHSYSNFNLFSLLTSFSSKFKLGVNYEIPNTLRNHTQIVLIPPQVSNSSYSFIYKIGQNVEGDCLLKNFGVFSTSGLIDFNARPFLCVNMETNGGLLYSISDSFEDERIRGLSKREVGVSNRAAAFLQGFPFRLYRYVQVNTAASPSSPQEMSLTDELSQMSEDNMYKSSTSEGTNRSTNNNLGRRLNYTFDVMSAKRSFNMCEDEDYIYKRNLKTAKDKLVTLEKEIEKVTYDYVKAREADVSTIVLANLDRRIKNLKLQRKSKGLSTTDRPIYLGVEMEVIPKGALRNNGEVNELIKEIANSPFGHHCVMKSDSSIGLEGFEIVTTPSTLKYHKEAFEKNFFGKPFMFHKKIQAAQSCGIHVHIAKNVFTKLTLGKFITFMNSVDNTEFINNMANRAENRFCSKLSLQGKNTKGMDVSAKIASGISLSDRNTHLPRGALNFGKPHTVEVRIFKSTNSMNNLFRKLEFCEALVKFVRVHSIQEMTAWHFVEWFINDKEVQNSYPYLRKWLASKNYVNHSTRRIKGKNKLVHLYGENLMTKPTVTNVERN